MQGRSAIFVLRVFDQMVGASISLTMVLPRVGQNDVARVMVVINEQKGLFLVVSVGHDNGAEGVVMELCRGFISKVEWGLLTNSNLARHSAYLVMV